MLFSTPAALKAGHVLPFPGFPAAGSAPGGTFRAALVEVAALPSIADESKGVWAYGELDAPPDFVRQVAAGAGESLVGHVDITTGSGYTAPPEQQIEVVKTPTTPFLLLFILPVAVLDVTTEAADGDFDFIGVSSALTNADSRIRIAFA